MHTPERCSHRFGCHADGNDTTGYWYAVQDIVNDYFAYNEGDYMFKSRLMSAVPYPVSVLSDCLPEASPSHFCQSYHIPLITFQFVFKFYHYTEGIECADIPCAISNLLRWQLFLAPVVDLLPPPWFLSVEKAFVIHLCLDRSGMLPAVIVSPMSFL